MNTRTLSAVGPEVAPRERALLALLIGSLMIGLACPLVALYVQPVLSLEGLLHHDVLKIAALLAIGAAIVMAVKQAHRVALASISAGVRETALAARLTDSINAVLMVIRQGDLGVHYASSAYERVWGDRLEDLSRRPSSWLDQIHPEDRGRVERALRNHDSAERLHLDYRLRGPDGSLQWIEHSALLTGKARSGAAYLYCIVLDATERQRSEQSLREKIAFSEWIYAEIPDWLNILDLSGAILDVSANGCRLMEIADPESVKQKPWVNLWPIDQRSRVMAALDRALAGERTGFQGRCPTASGTQKWWDVVMTPVENAHGQVDRLFVICRDITDQRLATERLRLFERAIEASTNAVMVADASRPDYPIAYVNSAFERITGYSAKESIGRNSRFLQGSDREQRSLPALRAALAEGRECHALLRNYRKDGRMFWNDLYLSPVRDDGGRVTHYVGIQNDVTAAKQREEDLKRLSNIDELTGLPSRNLLMDRVAQSILLAGRTDHRFAVINIDFGALRLINDKLGRDIGDKILKAFAFRLTTKLRDVDTVARIDGDRFAAIFHGAGSPTAILRIAQRLASVAARPIELEGVQHQVHPVMGISVYPQDGKDARTLLQRASEATRTLLPQDGERIAFFSPEIQRRIEKQLSIERALRSALSHDRFMLYFQPRVELSSGTVTAVEALIRWRDDQGRIVPPDEFIPIAEASGLIVDIGSWVLRETCMAAKRLEQAGHGDLRVSCNVSTKQLKDPKFIEKVRDSLAATGVNGGRIEVEIGESSMADRHAELMMTMRRLHILGVGIAIDDFGTGYSNLGHLQKYPLQCLKIDRSFVRNMTTAGNDHVIVKSISEMAHNMKRKVVAEGVETSEQAHHLEAIGCDEAQGFHFWHPMPIEDLLATLAARRGDPGRA